VAKSKQLRTFRDKPGQYLTLQLADRTGQIEARMWDDAEAAAALFEDGDPVLVKAVVEDYQGKQQLRVEKIRKARDDEYQRGDMVRSTDKDVRELFKEVRANVDRVQNPHLQQLLHAFFDDKEFIRAFAAAPGAKALHHAYRGGLIEHIVHCLRLANLVCDNYPELSRDLLLTGVLLHDIGKIDELESELSLEYTLAGQFTGHLCMGYQQVMAKIETLPGFPEDLALLVANMILGHHGRGDFGSPVLPKTVEAEILHHLENVDAQAQRWLDLIARERPTGKVWTEFFDHGLRRDVYLKTPEALGLAPPASANPGPEAAGKGEQAA
jgi:3'-5' exoribonuclease